MSNDKQKPQAWTRGKAVECAKDTSEKPSELQTEIANDLEKLYQEDKRQEAANDADDLKEEL